MRPLDALRGARRQLHRKLGRLPNVLGTGLGIKRRAGRITDRLALVVYVADKLAPSLLAQDALVPKFVRHRGRRIPTDVIQINRIRRELGSAPYALSDAATRGLLSAFARGEDDLLFGVSCAHCLAGADGNPHTTTSVGVWDSGTGRFEAAGESVFAVEAPGFGLPGNYGFSDAGLLMLDHIELLERANSSPTLPVLERPARGMAVYAQAYAADLSGTIDAIEVDVENLRTDMVIRIDGAGTHPGYSGMLWRTGSGQAVGIHAYGAEIDATSGRSRYSLAMSARRAAHQLQVEFLDAGS